MTSAEYEVGYAKPPEAKRFRKGRSGNSKGRPKLLARKTVTINGETKKIYAIQLRQIIAIDAAYQGDLKPLQAYFRQEPDMIRRINTYNQMCERQQAPPEERSDSDIERMLRSSPFLQEYHAHTEAQRLAALVATRTAKRRKKARLPKFDVTRRWAPLFRKRFGLASAESEIAIARWISSRSWPTSPAGSEMRGF